MARETINEGSTSYHPIIPASKDGNAVAPEAIRYRITGENGVELVAWTTIDVSTTEIEIPSTVNTIGATGGKKRYLVVEVTHGGGDKITEELEYTLRDLKGVTAA
jgi:hypothetical protein